MRFPSVLSWSLSLIIILMVIVGCSSRYAFNDQFDLRKGSERVQSVRFSQTRHIDSIMDLTRLSADVWKVEHYAYPDSIRMFVRVLDSNGYVITNMAQPYKRDGAPDYFRTLRETIGNGRRKRDTVIGTYTIREFGDKDSIPTYISLGLDFSGSMKGAWNAIKRGTDLFLSMKRPCDFIGLTTWHKNVTTVFPLSNDTAVINPAWRMHKDEAGGLYSSTYDGILSAMLQFKEQPIEAPKILVIFADGDENTSKGKQGDILELAVRNNVNIFTVGFAYAIDHELEALATYTGGKYYRAYTTDELMGIFADIYSSIRNYYLVTYRPPEFDGRHFIALDVSIPNADTLVARGMYDKFYNPADTGLIAGNMRYGKRFGDWSIDSRVWKGIGGNNSNLAVNTDGLGRRTPYERSGRTPFPGDLSQRGTGNSPALADSRGGANNGGNGNANNGGNGNANNGGNGNANNGGNGNANNGGNGNANNGDNGNANNGDNGNANNGGNGNANNGGNGNANNGGNNNGDIASNNGGNRNANNGGNNGGNNGANNGGNNGGNNGSNNDGNNDGNNGANNGGNNGANNDGNNNANNAIGSGDNGSSNQQAPEFSRAIQFAYKSSIITPESFEELDEIAQNLKFFTRIELEIVGHTDSVGGPEYNLGLSLQRAEAVKTALVQRGVEPRRLRTAGVGLTQPVATNDTEEGRALNRRTVFRIVRN
jgi:outer membrane protein OmpA-like peptidoglycan-associated protein